MDVSHRGTLLWRQIAKGRATVVWAGMKNEMVQGLRGAVSAVPRGSAMAAPSASGDAGLA